MNHSRMGDSLPFGCHRVREPRGVLPQAAERLDPSLPIKDTELLLAVETLHLDSASFQQMWAECHHEKAMADRISAYVAAHGKQVNPVTGSGGMLIGRVTEIGPDYQGPEKFCAGDRVATLISLTLTPLSLKEIKKIHVEGSQRGQVDVSGHAILFSGAPAAKIPDDLPEELVLKALDVCGAPAQVARRVQKGQTVLILGAGGRSGLLSLAQARENLGETGLLLGFDFSDAALSVLKRFAVCDEVAKVNAQAPLDVYDRVTALTKGRMADCVFNNTNVPLTEMSAILSARPGGTVFFFNMATHFARAVLGAEGVGHDVELIMGNGFVPGHAEHTLNMLRKNSRLRQIWSEA